MMLETLRSLGHDALVLFAMVNAVGNLPIFADLTGGMARPERHRVFRLAIGVAVSIVLVFAFLGSWMLRSVFQIETAAVQVAGGILVFLVAARGMLRGPRRSGAPDLSARDDLAVFPLGFPYLAGPGTILTTILLMQSGGSIVTAAAALLVYAAVLPVLYLAPMIHRAVGQVGALVIARILYIFIAAKAIDFLMTGVRAYLKAGA